MKDEKPWPSSRVDLSLDNRQIFLLFFASAVVLSLVFALGVVVGRRMDAGPARPGATDPLALLDQMGGDDSDEGLSYQQVLSSTATRAPAGPTARAEPAAAPGSSPAPPAVIARPTAPGSVPAAGRTPAAAPPPGPAPLPTAAVAPRPAAASPGATSKDKGSNKPRKAAETSEGEGTYTLQLSSFQERREAESFMEKLRQNGLKPYMTPTSIPGRGVWFRVRRGHFKTWDDALTAKQNFEKTQKVIAYVSKS